jgi:hypothetical protein
MKLLKPKAENKQFLWVLLSSICDSHMRSIIESIEDKMKRILYNGVANKQSTFLFYKVPSKSFVFSSKVQNTILFLNRRNVEDIASAYCILLRTQ